MPVDLTVLLAALLTGLLGGLHCAAMCGGIATGLAASLPKPGLGPAFALNGGRLLGYTLAGAIVGGFGGGLLTLARSDGLATSLRVAMGVVLLVAAGFIALMAEEIIGLMFGAQWLAAARLASILALAALPAGARRFPGQSRHVCSRRPAPPVQECFCSPECEQHGVGQGLIARKTPCRRERSGQFPRAGAPGHLHVKCLADHFQKGAGSVILRRPV